MRLVDFDKLIELYSEYFGKYTINELKEIREENMPFTKAIPVEWIERWLDRVTGTKDGDDISKYHDIVKGGILFINMLERDWEKENGISQ